VRKKIKFDTEYKLATSDVFLDVVIGEGQTGSISVKLGDTLIAQEDKIASLPVGNGNNLKDKKLIILCDVQDMLIETNNTSVTFTLKGGESKYRYTCMGTVDEDMDKIEYKIKINLI
jgi:hypothetical protein